MKNWLTVIVSAVILVSGLIYTLFVLDLFPERNDINVEKEVPSDKTQLTFWRNHGNEAENKAYEELVSSFEAANPDITINMKSIPYSDYEIRLRTEIADGNPPDIMAIDSPTLALYANTGSLLSLDRYMKEEGNIEDIPESTLKGLSYEGQLYLSPIVESSIALFYNMHLFDEAGLPYPSGEPDDPLTWEEVLEISKKVDKPEKGIIGIDPAQGFGDGEAPAYFKTPFLWQFGAEVLSPDGTTASGYLDSKEALEALQFFKELYHKHEVASVELPPAAFETNQLAMTVIGSWSLKDFGQNAGLKLGEDFGIAPLPRAKYQAVPNGGWALGISSGTKHSMEAWKFVQYATSYEGMKKYVTITGDLPARFSVAKDIPELNEYPVNIFMEQALNYSKNRPVTPAYPIVSHAIKIMFEEVGIGGKDVNEAAREAVEKINTGIDEIQKP